MQILDNTVATNPIDHMGVLACAVNTYFMMHNTEETQRGDGAWFACGSRGSSFDVIPNFIARRRDRLYSLCTICESLAGGTKDNGLWLLWISVTEQPAF
jgi:hypothetical protein